MPMFERNMGIKCHLAGSLYPKTWWRDSNPRALLCRQLPGLSGTPRANDTRRPYAAGSKFISQAFAGLRRVSLSYWVVSPGYGKVAPRCLQ